MRTIDKGNKEKRILQCIVDYIRSDAVLDDNSEKLISANIVLLQFV